MPLNYSYGNQHNSDLMNTFNSVTATIRKSNNKNDAIKTLSDMHIKGTNTKIGNSAAHAIYNKYVQYNGNGGGRRR